MDELNKYNTYKHKQTEICWGIINIVLSCSYILEVFKQNRTIPYILAFCFATWLPYIIFCTYKHTKNTDDNILEYVAGIGYLFFYAFAMSTSQNKGVFCYIFPMLCILTVYCNKKLNSIVMAFALIINILNIMCSVMLKHETSATDITFYEIQIACVLLCTIFLWRSSEILLLRDNMISALSQEAYYDILTQIHNRAFLDKLEYQYKNTGDNIKSIAIIDIDDFKLINDKYGHQVGDEVLKNLAEAMAYVCKSAKAIPVRLGGDEFVIVSNTLVAKDMYSMCEDIVRRLKKCKVQNHNSNVIEYTISIGVTNGVAGYTFTDLYNSVDQALYQAKSAGKNQIIMIQTYFCS